MPKSVSKREPSATARAVGLARGALGWLGAHKHTVRAAALALIGLFVVLAIKRTWDSLPRGYSWHVGWPLLALGWLLLVAQELSFALIWRSILARLGSHLPVRSAQQIYLGSEFVRYIPGNVWHVLTRIAWAERRGVPRATGLASMTIELATKIAGAALLFALSLLLWRDVSGLTGWFGRGLPLALGVVGVPLLLVGLHPRVLTGALNAGLRALGRPPVSFTLRYRDILWITLLWLLSWVVAGVGFYLLVLALQPSGFSLAALGIAAGIYALGWDIGFLSFITPSGFGFREGALALLLGLAGVVPVAAVGVAIAIVARLAVTAAELVCVAGAHWLPGGRAPEVGETADGLPPNAR
jgi:uncharacterized membrane protein YbhN (UPF0104 family)